MRISAILGATLALVIGASLTAASPQAPAAKKGPQATEGGGRSATVDLSKYPMAVRTTIETETKNATLKSVSKEKEKGQTQYEVETLVNGKSRDLLVDPSGKVLEVEEEIALDAAPAPVQETLRTRGRVLKVERVLHGDVTSYEVEVRGKSGKKSSLALDGQGKPIKG